MTGYSVRIIRKIKIKMDSEFISDEAKTDIEEAEMPMAQLALNDERRI